MKKIFLLINLFILFSGYSQSTSKKLADLRKNNKIKETSIYQINLDNSNKKTLWNWSSFDKEGRLIESKWYLSNGKLKTHYKFEHPHTKTRILVSYDKRGKEINRFEQDFDLSGEKEPLLEFSENGIFRYEYDDNGNTTKIWRIKENPELLQTEITFDNNKLRVIVKSLVFRKDGSTFISTNQYKRDSEGNVEKITTESNGIISSIEIHEHKKYSI